MKKIIFTALLIFSSIAVSYSQNSNRIRIEPDNYSIVTNSFWSNWYVQAGFDMTLFNPYGCNFSNVFPNGKTFGLNVAIGKWFSPEVSLRGRINWENGFPLFENHNLTWVAPSGRNGINMDEGGNIAIYADVQLSVHNIIWGYDETRKWNMLVFPRAGFYSNLAVSSSSPMVGVGIGSTYKLTERLSLYADIAYQVLTSESFGSGSTTGMGVSAGSNGFLDFHIGVQWELGKSKGKFKRLLDYK